MRQVLICMALAVCISPLAASAEGQAECRHKITVAQNAGIIYWIYVKPDGVQVVVDVDTWSQSSYTTKLGLAATVECAMVNPGERLSAVVLRSHRTNKVVGRYRYPKLEVK